MAVAMIGPKFYAWDRNGKPLAFGKLYTYQARTNEPKATYQTEDQITENTNPIILNGEGYANVYLDGSYKMVLKDKDDNEIWSSDPVTGAQANEWTNCYSATYISSTSFKVAGNQVGIYLEGRTLRINNNAPEYEYTQVESAVYAAEETTVTVKDDVITTGLNAVCTSVVSRQAHNSSFGRSEVGAHDEIYIRTVTSNKAITENAPLGTRYKLTDLDAEYIVDTGLTPDGFIIIEISPTKQLRRTSFPNQTYSEKTWYVDAAATGKQDGSSSKPFSTIQQAWDAIPTIVRHQQIIELADGIYNESSIIAGDQPRPAILWGKGKITTFRSTLDGEDLTAPILIKGTTRIKSAVSIETTANLTYGVYINKGNIAFQNLTIKSPVEANNLLTAHRTDVYLHCENVDFDGVTGNAQNGVFTESNGHIELANNCNVTGSQINVRSFTDGDNITISGNSTITNATNRNIQVDKGYVRVQLTDPSGDLAMITGGANPVYIDTGAKLEVRGIDNSNRVIVNDGIEGVACTFEAVFSEIGGIVNMKLGSELFLNSSLASRSIFMRSSNIFTSNSSIITSDVNPLSLLEGSEIYKEGTNTIQGSSGKRETKNVPELQITANGSVVTMLANATRYSVTGVGAIRTGCTLNPDALPIGETISIEGSSWDVEFVDSAKADFGGSIQVGNTAGSYSGFSGFVDDTGIFRVTSLGFIR